ncbi:hypothetical protein KI387_003111, partial [Taxus chinensis]
MDVPWRTKGAHDKECRQQNGCAHGAQKGHTTKSVDSKMDAPMAHKRGARQRVSTAKWMRPMAHKRGARTKSVDSKMDAPMAHKRGGTTK